MEFRTATKRCFRCGSKSHYSLDCYSNNWNCLWCDSVNSGNVSECKICNEPGGIFGQRNKSIEEKESVSFRKNNCFRCGRMNHWANNCYAKTDVNGRYIKNY